MKANELPRDILSMVDEDSSERLRRAAEESPSTRLRRAFEECPSEQIRRVVEAAQTPVRTFNWESFISLAWRPMEETIAAQREQEQLVLRVARELNHLDFHRDADHLYGLYFDESSRSRAVMFGIEGSSKPEPVQSSTSQTVQVEAVRVRQPSLPALRAVHGAGRAFEAISLLVPKRICNEELGDAIEKIHLLVKQGRPTWQIYIKVVSTVFWISINALREVTSVGVGRVRSK